MAQSKVAGLSLFTPDQRRQAAEAYHRERIAFEQCRDVLAGLNATARTHIILSLGVWNRRPEPRNEIERADAHWSGI
jgi:hypothetical protein